MNLDYNVGFEIVARRIILRVVHPVFTDEA
jgi:hypothetical protein